MAPCMLHACLVRHHAAIASATAYSPHGMNNINTDLELLWITLLVLTASEVHGKRVVSSIDSGDDAVQTAHVKCLPETEIIACPCTRLR